MKENIVSNLRVPSCAKDVKGIWCGKHGFVASTMTCEGTHITFLRTDFLKFEREPWYCAERFSARDYHEEFPEEVMESIQKSGGFFITRDYLKDVSGERVVPCERRSYTSYYCAKDITSKLNVQELKSDLMYGVIYDVLGKWLMETRALTKEEWLNSPKDEKLQKEILMRDQGGWNLKELFGDIFKNEWTQELFSEEYAVLRSGTPCSDGEGEYPSRMRLPYKKDTALEAFVRGFLYFE